jgi:[pyruvate, water dikinase]-phosphate phosphotransferase / [pyruvate, water dikinase] kinase
MADQYVCMLSDATGGTAERVVRATLAQFPDSTVMLEVISGVENTEQMRAVVDKAKSRRGLIAYTLVSPALRREIALLANEAGVVSVDLLGPLMTVLSELLTATPSYRPGLFADPNAEHYQRLDAIAFTVSHDDGQRVHELERADLVLVGPSRTSKTPLSVYLAHTRGLKVANVPLALGIDPFDQLEGLTRPSVVGLTMNPQALSRLRMVRQEHLGAENIQYAGLDYVRRELHFCHEVYRRHPTWIVVDVTGKAIEEVAANLCPQRVA